MEFLILTGMSGGGKTQASNTLEDMGYYCIDNMPAALIAKFAELYTQTPGKAQNVAFIFDVRGELEFDTLFDQLDALKKRGYACRTVFIDCNDRVLLNRYKETRRLHPLVALKNVTVSEAITLERDMLAPVKSRADYVIDTSTLSPLQLRDRIKAILFASDSGGGMIITSLSFGYKYGIATEADLVFDVRCFPNPYYEATLKNLTGLDDAVRDYVFSFEKTNLFMEKLYDMVDFLLPQYIDEGKPQLIVAFGCTGGKHRSVAIAEALAAHLRAKNYNTVTIHRDIVKKFAGDK
jgi:Predicted P-loop-containing kinase